MREMKKGVIKRIKKDESRKLFIGDKDVKLYVIYDRFFLKLDKFTYKKYLLGLELIL